MIYTASFKSVILIDSDFLVWKKRSIPQACESTYPSWTKKVQNFAEWKHNSATAYDFCNECNVFVILSNSALIFPNFAISLSKSIRETLALGSSALLWLKNYSLPRFLLTRCDISHATSTAPRHNTLSGINSNLPQDCCPFEELSTSALASRGPQQKTEFLQWVIRSVAHRFPIWRRSFADQTPDRGWISKLVAPFPKILSAIWRRGRETHSQLLVRLVHLLAERQSPGFRHQMCVTGFSRLDAAILPLTRWGCLQVVAHLT